MAEAAEAPARRIDQIKDMIAHYAALAEQRPLTGDEKEEAMRRYDELLHGEPEPIDDGRRSELAAQCAEATAHLVTAEQREALLENGRLTAAGEDIDPVPVVRLFAPDGAQSWLLTELAEDQDTAYGLCDLGIGQPECGEVSLSWIARQSGAGREHRGPSPYDLRPERHVYTRMAIERDPGFPGKHTPTLSFLDKAAFAAGRIII